MKGHCILPFSIIKHVKAAYIMTFTSFNYISNAVILFSRMYLNERLILEYLLNRKVQHLQKGLLG